MPTTPSGKRKRTSSLSPWSPPLFRWAGSKRKLLPTLIDYLPADYKRYIEPFAGSACLFFATNPNSAILGDINAELLRTYEIVRSHPRLVARLSSSYPNTPDKYYALRDTDPESLGAIERAARFVYLNRNCFNGIYRTNKSGKFNVPRGIRTGQVQDERVFYRCSIALRSAIFEAGDFEACLKGAGPTDFVYLDPPYAISGKRMRGEYGYQSFAATDIPRLVKALKELDRKQCKFLLSYADASELRDLIPRHWNCDRLSVRRHVAGFVEHRTFAREVLVYNYCKTVDADKRKKIKQL